MSTKSLTKTQEAILTALGRLEEASATSIFNCIRANTTYGIDIAAIRQSLKTLEGLGYVSKRTMEGLGRPYAYSVSMSGARALERERESRAALRAA